MVVDEEGVGFGGGEGDADVVGGRVQGVEGDVRVLVHAVRRELERGQVLLLFTRDPVCFK